MNKASKPIWAIPIILLALIGGYTLAAFAGVLPHTVSQAPGDEASPTPEASPPAAPAPTPTPAPGNDLAPPPESAQPTPEEVEGTPRGTPVPGVANTEVQVERLTADQIKQFEDELAELRDKIMKTKARLMQLREQLMLGSVSIISLSILHSHEVGGAFKLESLSYTLDGFEIYSGVNTPESNLENLQNFPIYEGSLLPGEHLLVVDMIFRGRGYGIFSYLNQYLFKVKARYLFTVNEGDVVTLKVVSYDEGSFLTSLRNRLKVKFTQE